MCVCVRACKWVCGLCTTWLSLFICSFLPWECYILLALLTCLLWFEGLLHSTMTACTQCTADANCPPLLNDWIRGDWCGLEAWFMIKQQQHDVIKDTSCVFFHWLVDWVTSTYNKCMIRFLAVYTMGECLWGGVMIFIPAVSHVLWCVYSHYKPHSLCSVYILWFACGWLAVLVV